MANHQSDDTEAHATAFSDQSSVVGHPSSVAGHSSSVVGRPSSLKDRTLTNLYNRRPDWLAEAHRRLDAAVFDAYGWPRDLGDDAILARRPVQCGGPVCLRGIHEPWLFRERPHRRRVAEFHRFNQPDVTSRSRGRDGRADDEKEDAASLSQSHRGVRSLC